MSVEFDLERHFSSKSAVVRDIYDSLLVQLRHLGPIKEEAKKTSIHLVNSSALAGVATRKTYLLLNIKSDQKIESPRINKSEKLSANRYHFEVKLTDPSDIDTELLGWLERAYQLSA